MLLYCQIHPLVCGIQNYVLSNTTFLKITRLGSYTVARLNFLRARLCLLILDLWLALHLCLLREQPFLISIDMVSRHSRAATWLFKMVVTFIIQNYLIRVVNDLYPSKLDLSNMQCIALS